MFHRYISSVLPHARLFPTPNKFLLWKTSVTLSVRLNEYTEGPHLHSKGRMVYLSLFFFFVVFKCLDICMLVCSTVSQNVDINHKGFLKL